MIRKEEASVRLGPKTLRTLDEEVKSLVSAWRLVMNSWKLGMSAQMKKDMTVKPCRPIESYNPKTS